MTKKVYEQKCFSVLPKNLTWKILTKNLVTLSLCEKEGLDHNTISNQNWPIDR